MAQKYKKYDLQTKKNILIFKKVQKIWNSIRILKKFTQILKMCQKSRKKVPKFENYLNIKKSDKRSHKGPQKVPKKYIKNEPQVRQQRYLRWIWF